jgi:4-diphosphocytidyl-2-C-methyl-D-erythritol kinase (EC 2.7.1.148)
MNIGHITPGSWMGAPAPAKLNLFLKVTGRRPDGYHELQTLFTFLDYGDTLDFVLREDGSIERETEWEGVPATQDLILRAATLLQAAARVSQGVSVRLVKRLPMGGGLGGGSSDAATTLLVLNRLWGVNWTSQRLAELGLRLGADVPVFVQGMSALARGVGEILQPVAVPERWYVVVFPGVGLSTAAVFSAPDLTRNAIPVRIQDFSGKGVGNDLVPVACRLEPKIHRLMAWLGQYGEARMSGSGSCCFLDFEREFQARQVYDVLPDDYSGFVARGQLHHPLRNR